MAAADWARGVRIARRGAARWLSTTHRGGGGGRGASRCGGGGRGPRRRSATAPSERTRRAEPTRFAAYTLLRAVDDGAYANLEMPAILRRHRLEGRDAAFATELAFGTIRWQGFYDAVIAEAAGRPTDRIDPQVLDVLRLGAHQLLGMRVATHAAADQTVGPGQGRRRGRGQRVRQRRDAPDQRALARGVARGRGARRVGEQRRSRCGTATPSGSSPRCGPPCSATAAPRAATSTPSSRPC